MTAGPGKVLLEAYRLGCLYDSWSDEFDNEKWMQAFENTGVDLEFYTMRKRDLDELFPWDFIDVGVSKIIPEAGMGACHERGSYAKLPGTLLGLRRNVLSGRCLL